MAYIGASPPASALTASDIADGIISEAKMANDAISLAELKAGTDGEIISWDASANPVAIGAGSSGEFLKSQGAGSVPVFATVSAGFTEGTQVATTSGSYIDFTSIPAGVKYILLHFNEISLSGSDAMLIQIGDSGGVETSSYVTTIANSGPGSSAVTSVTDGLRLYLNNAARATKGVIKFSLMQASSNSWMMDMQVGTADWLDTGIAFKTLSGTLDRIRLDTNGSDTFDAGTANLIYI